MVQFAIGTLYIFVDISLMVLYQLESLNLDDYNLMYIQNKNRGFDKILTAFPLKTQHSLFYNHSSKPIQTNQNNAKQPQAELKPSKNTFIPHLGFY